MKKKSLFVALSVAAATMFAGLAGLNLAWSSWFNAGVESLTQGDTLGAAWTAPSSADDVSVGNARIDIDTDEELVYTPAASSSSQIVRCDMSVYPTLHGGFPDEAPADDVQTMLVPYTNNGVVAWAACVKVGGETNWVSLTGVTPTPNALTDVRIEFDYRATPQVSFSVKSGGEYVALQDGGGNVWFDTLNAKTEVSSIAFTGEGAIASLAGANGAILPDVARYNGTAYASFDAAIAAGVADGFANGAVTLLDDATWTPSAAGAYQIDVNGNTLTINGATGSWSGTTYTVAKLTNYYWIGGDSTEWANGGNWSHTLGGVAANEYPDSQSHNTSDYAYFPEGASLTLDDFVTVRSIFTDGTLTLAGNGNGGVRTASANNSAPFTLGGTGLVRLAGVTINVPYATSSAGAETQISNSVEVVAGTTNFFRLCTGNSRYASLHLRGSLSGSGHLVIWTNTGFANYQTYFYGDASAFTGTLADHRDEDEYGARFNVMSAAALSGTATYNLAATNNTAGQNYVLRAGGTGTTYRMGALNGEVHFDGNNNSKTTQYYGYTLEIGGKNEDCSFGGTLARGGYPSYTKKVGSADMTFTGAQIPYLDIANGTYIIGATSALPVTAMTFSGGAFSVAEGVSVDPVSKFAADSTAAVVFDDRGIDSTWGGELTDTRVPFGFTKKGAGTLTLATAPAHTTKTTVEEGVLVVPQGTTIAVLSCTGGKLTVPLTGTEDGTSVLTVTSLAEGTTVDDLEEAVAVAGTAMSVESGEGGYVVRATRTPQTFTWTGAIDTDWSKSGNWVVGGVAATTAPLAIDTVRFASAGASVSLASGATVAMIVVDAATTFSIPDNSPLRSPLVCGDGVITLTEGFFAPLNAQNAECVVSNDIVFAEGYDGSAYLAGTDYQSIWLYGDISGTGTLTIYEGSRRNAGIRFYGSAAGFSGSISVNCSNQYRRDLTKFLTTNAVNANVAYSFWGNDSGSDTFEAGEGESEKYWRLGSVDGRIYMNTTKATGHTIEVGALNSDFSCGGTIGRKNSGGDWYYLNTVRKVGTGTFTSSINYAGTYDIAEGNLLLETNALPIAAITFNGGTLVLTNAFNETDLDIAATIRNSTSPIVIDTGDDDYTFATALAASNVGGFTKKGAGTLTLDAVPAYTGITTVVEGSLVVPVGTEVWLNAFYTSNVPENATVVGYGYPAGTTLTGAESVRTFDKPLDVANVVAIDLSGATLVPRQAFVIATATEIQNFNANNIVLTLPEGTDPTLWRLAAANGELRLSPRRTGVSIRLQ